MELSRHVVVHCHGHLSICPIWTGPWTKNLSNLAQIGSGSRHRHRSLKPLDGFSPFKALWDCLRLKVVQCHTNLPICPIWACPCPKTCQIRQHLGQTCGSHIPEIAGCIYTIRSYVELSRPVVAQHHCHFIFTLAFQGQI